MTGELSDIEGNGGYSAIDQDQRPPDGRYDRLRNVAATCGRMAGKAGLLGLRTGLVAGCGAASLGAFGETTANIGPTTVAAEMTIDLSGDAVAELSLGQVTFDASDGPLGMKLRVTAVNSNAPSMVRSQFDNQALEAGTVTSASSTDAVFKPYESSLNELLDDTKRKGALLLLGGGIFGGLAGELAIGYSRNLRRKEHPSREHVLKMGATALLIPNLLLAGAGTITAATLHDDALEHPRFGNDSLGELASFAQSSAGVLDVYTEHSDRMTEWLDNLVAIQQNAESLPNPDQNLVPVLAISDTHSRPCSYNRAQSLIDAFGVAFVINAGDESEWGQTFEQSVFSCGDSGSSTQIEHMGDLQLPNRSGRIPIILTPGNHDSRSSISSSADYPNVIIPRSETVEVTVPHMGKNVTFRLAGGVDPLNTPLFWERPSRETENELVCRLGENIAEAAIAGDADIAVVHAPTAGNVIDEVLGEENDMLIIQGHTHRFRTDPERNIVTLGTFGGAGLRTLQKDVNEVGSTVQATIMYFDATSKKLVWGWDLRVHNDGASTAEPFYFQTAQEQLAADESVSAGE